MISLKFSSLRFRVVIVSTVVLFLFAAIAFAVLDNAFDQAARNAVKDQLNAQLYALLTAAELTEDADIYFPERPAEPRFSVAGSGLYAFVYDESPSRVWRSESSVSVSEPPAVQARVGSTVFGTERLSDGTTFFVLRFGVAWDLGDDIRRRFTFVLTEDLSRYRAQLAAFRRNLFLWGALGIGGLLLLQLFTLRWALRPLGDVAAELVEVERGAQERIVGAYPDEISGLTRNINALIDSSQRMLQRYRHSLGDLAHSLKTPLAVLRGLSEQDADAQGIRTTLREQTVRMGDIVEHQLKRAVSSGGSAHVREVDLEVVAGQIKSTLDKVYVDRHIDIRLDIEAGLHVAMETGDLMEVIGNLAENACKWCHAEVLIQARYLDSGVELIIHDDGPGIDPTQAKDVLQRGVRVDQQTPGQGIGLAVVRDILDSYDGRLQIGKSPSGGAGIRVFLPGR